MAGEDPSTSTNPAEVAGAADLPKVHRGARRSEDTSPDLSEPEVHKGRFTGGKWRMFLLAGRTGALTVLTLGFYRFWMKTRLRRWYWSAVRIGNFPLEYVGDPLEKLLGFLIAVVFLAFYIGVVNLLLMFASFSLFQGSFPAYFLSLLGVLPLWFYARYRAWRYVLARTRWRGIRFGLAAGAWGYAWRALVHWALAILTLGILWPRKTFWLEKYRTDRTWYGSHRLQQGGRWRDLLGAMKHLYVSVGIAAAMVGYGAITESVDMVVRSLVLSPWIAYGLAFWRARSFSILTRNKTAHGITFESQARPARIFGIYVLGYSISGFIALFVLVPLVLVAAAIFSGFGFGATLDLGPLDDLPSWFLSLLGAVLYFSLFLVWGALRHAFVTVPLWAHFTETLTVLDHDGLKNVHQRARDEFEEAEGFAEALDVGAAI
ncbi:DUF898 family protein [Shimia biformata]|uniref:DUF898 family protein n=1 Tax=Shimia biformata TaxID=1294299 RepID=UPI001950C518|nr:DUF898 family protein [Shimia biformata]